jgi:5S rRNA maturation endonuclease (ribonuclease M5)
LFQKQRFVDEHGKKTFRQRKPDGEGGWSYQLGEVPRVLYRLPQIANAIANGKSVWVVEGEKDADTLVEAGYEATTMPNGAGTWLDIHTESLAGATVFLISDNDEVGQKHALDVADILREAGCKVKIGIPPEGYKDVTDLYEDGKSVKNLIPFGVDETVQEEEQTSSEMEELLGGLELVLRRDDISEESRLARAGILLNSFSRGANVDYGRLVHWEDFLLEEDDDSYDWVIPGVIEKQERVIVVAAEGVGKTMLARQVAICASAGINPFTMSRMEPVRTLTVDLENPERIIRRTSRNIMNAARTLGHTQHNLAELLVKPSGLDLLKQSDRAVLEKAIEESQPQLLVMGPVYKAFIDPGGRTSESVAIEVARYLDGLRDAYGCAMWLEHHAPLGSSMGSRDLRPFGSAVWSRWPEFGLSLTPDPTATEGFVYNVSHFRGARDRRKFPTKMRRGKVFPFEVLEFMKVDE